MSAIKLIFTMSDGTAHDVPLPDGTWKMAVVAEVGDTINVANITRVAVNGLLQPEKYAYTRYNDKIVFTEKLVVGDIVEYEVLNANN